MGAKYPASPLGLITLAALLPADWELRLVDMNTAPLEDSDIDWADLVFIGGMLPQQSRFLRLIDRVHARGKRVVAGGPDPTSQPHLYRAADYLVLGEAERSLPPFLDDLAKGIPSGEYRPDRRPAMTETPIPRFDLLRLRDYLMIGIQFSRGCPFNCEFCDIIELYGREPRTKSPQQVVAELDALHRLGHRGHVDFVDDNFIGQKGRAKEILRAVKAWSEAHGHPFYYSTEASINLADDDELLALMRDLDFRYVFVGIESADEEVLASAQKRQNLARDIAGDLRKIYGYGIVVNGGFILGFDEETSASARRMVDIIERGNIVMAMVGLLFALPNTQLTRRLARENRLLDDAAQQREGLESTEVDQTTSGINFITKRPRAEVIGDFLHVLREAYSTRRYFDRCLRLARAISVTYAFRPSWRRKLQYAAAFLKIAVKLGLRPSTSYYFWRNIVAILFRRISSLETVVNLMAMYLHFGRQARFIARLMAKNLNGGCAPASSALRTEAEGDPVCAVRRGR
ncbi:MAG: B12-binding domain-containing radical SAM protein [Planctomycetes bacterium]|nr:B12-binding domain-containing radical SAM protein [Planctomycetota bacterium]